MIKSRLFWVGLILRILLLPFPISPFPGHLLLTFIDQSLLNIGQNPWDLLPIDHFPYGSVQYFLMVVPKFILHLFFGDAVLGLNSFSFAAYKISILAVDVAFLGLLLKFPLKKPAYIYGFYWLNPVLIFVSYIHGQLDIFSIFFLTSAMYVLNFGKEKYSALLLSFAILCKFQVVAVVPLFLLFLWSRYFRAAAVEKLIHYCSIIVAVVMVGFLPHFLSSSFGYASVQSPEAQRVFSLSLSLGGEHEILIGFCIIIFFITRLLLSSRITWQGLIYSSAMLLGVLLLTTLPMPGWYFWIYPFVALFCAQYVTRLPIVVVASIFFYLLYFFPMTLNRTSPKLIESVTFAMLQMSFLVILFSIWFFVVRIEMPWFRRKRPLLVGIAGNSGSGKNTLSSAIYDIFGRVDTSIIEGDDYHKWERGNTKWQDYTHLNPKANYLEELSTNILNLIQGQSVFKSHYDHSTGQFSEQRLLTWKKNIVVQGLHTFYPIIMRNILDIKVFIRPDESLRRFWKIKRDFTERGHPIGKILDSIKSREVDSATHIDPQSQYSNWIIDYIPTSATSLEINDPNIEVDFFQRDVEFYQIHSLINDTPIENLLEELRKVPSLSISSEPDNDNIDFIKVECRGTIKATEIQTIAEHVFENIRYLTRSSKPPIWHGGFEGINQLIFLALIARSERHHDFY